MNRNQSRKKPQEENHMETVAIAGTDLDVSRIVLGTWAIGGWM
ncbi:MAG: hypothetical protein PVG51_01640 [Desulfosarcina sp.]|jgi:hypothetical protein